MKKVVLCKRCGQTIMPAFYKGEGRCFICHNKLTVTNLTFDDFINLGADNAEQWINDNMIHDGMTNYYISKRERYHKEQRDNIQSQIKTHVKQEPKQIQKQSSQNTFIPHCPICGSPDLTKLSAAGKAVKIGLFGIFGAGSLGKTYKCNNCGVKFQGCRRQAFSGSN